MSTTIDGLQNLIDDYDLFLIDQFGVLHDGVTLYPKVLEALAYLKSQNKEVVIVSNSGKRSAVNVHRLENMGIDSSLYSQCMTSGEVAHHYLKSLLNDSVQVNCFLISRDGDTSVVGDLDMEIVNSAGEANLIIIGGSEGDRFNETYYEQLLKPAAMNKTRCLCTNPDKKMLTTAGLKFGAGRIAEIYQELGGDVLWFDNELSTLLVKSGIIEKLTPQELNQQFDQFNVKPDYILQNLRR